MGVLQQDLNGEKHVYAVLVNLYSYEDLQKDEFSPASDTVQQLMRLWESENMFTLILTDSMKKVKDECSYFDSEVMPRIISVGNMSSIRSAMTFDAGDKLTDSPFNTVRPNVIKAYYYNKGSDKTGRFRMYQIDELIALVRPETLDILPGDTGGDNGFSGLFGN